MRDGRFFLVFLILAVAQTILSNFLNLSHYLVLSFLPMLILLLPVHIGNVAGMITAFVLGFLVDLFSGGVPGLTSLALVPLAAVRHGIITLVFGEEVYARGENVTLRRQGVPKMALAILISCAVFFIVFIWADSAGTLGFWFCILKILLSSLVSTVVSMMLAGVLTSE